MCIFNYNRMCFHWSEDSDMFRVLDDTTILLAKFSVSTRTHLPFDQVKCGPHSLTLGYRYLLLPEFRDFDESLAWCRTMRFGAKVVPELIMCPENKIEPGFTDCTDWQVTHDGYVKLRFKKLSHATHWKMRWWQ